MDDNQYKINIPIIPKDRRLGVSGIMRVKNDGEFIATSIDSCIEALDELIIVYNDCTDNSPSIIEQKRKQYPDKIKVFEYKPPIYAFDLTEEDFKKVKTLPLNNPHLLSNYYNFTLSKISYRFFMKIDADQIYFSDKLKVVCDAYRATSTSMKLALRDYFVINVVSFSFRVCDRFHFYFPIWLSKKYEKKYFNSILKLVKRDKSPLSLSGVNLLWMEKQWYVTLGGKGEINILPPYNGVGDHLIMELKDDVYFEPYVCDLYSKSLSQEFAIIEKLKGSNRTYPLGLFWFHLNANRKGNHELITKYYNLEKIAAPISVFLKKKAKMNVHALLDFISKRNIVYYRLLNSFFSLPANLTFEDNFDMDESGILIKHSK